MCSEIACLVGGLSIQGTVHVLADRLILFPIHELEFFSVVQQMPKAGVEVSVYCKFLQQFAVVCHNAV